MNDINANKPLPNEIPMKDGNEQLSFVCPNCHQQIITIKNNFFEDTILSCPKCGQKGIMRLSPKKQDSIKTNIVNHNINFADTNVELKKKKNLSFDVKILGLLIIIFGIAFQYIFNLLSYKIIFTLVIIGVVIFIFIPNHRKIYLPSKRINDRKKSVNTAKPINNSSKNSLFTYLNGHFDIAEKIAFMMILWISIIFFFTGVDDLDIFFIFVYLGVLFIRIFSAEYITHQVKQKLNIMTIVFLCIFILVIIRRIFSIGNIFS